MIGGNEKRDLQKQRNRAAERVDRPVIILPVVFGEHHETFVALKGAADVVHPRCHLPLFVSLVFLHGIGFFVHRQNQQVHDQTDCDDGQPRIVEIFVHEYECDLNQELDRVYKNGV